MCQLVGIVLTAVLSTIVGPSISHSTTVPASSRHRMSLAQIAGVVAGVGDEPIVRQRAERGVADDRRPVHLPHHHRAGVVAPQDVGTEVAVEVAGVDDVPVSRQASRSRCRRRCWRRPSPTGAPCRLASRSRMSREAVAGEVRDLPRSPRSPGLAITVLPMTFGPIHLPQHQRAGVVAPQDVVAPVAVEVAGVLDVPVVRQRARPSSSGMIGAIHLPQHDGAGSVAPQDVAACRRR